jgi:predicted oxidoreductase
MAWSPLGGGTLMSGANVALDGELKRVAEAHGVDIAAVAVAWLLRHPSGILPVLGTNNLGRIARIADALDVEMDRQTWFALYTAALGHEVP